MSFQSKGLAALTVFLCLCTSQGKSENRSIREAGEHLLAVVPMTGAGTWDDPRRPLFVPRPQDIDNAVAAGQAPTLLSNHFVMADDGQHAIVEFVSTNHKALQTILEAGRAGIISVYRPSQTALLDLVTEMKKLKSDFDWNTFRGKPTSLTTIAPQAGGSH